MGSNFNVTIGQSVYREADIASASVTDIGNNVPVSRVNITNSATISSFGTLANCWRHIRFSGTATLVHNATSLILPAGGNNITAEAGDTAEAYSDNSGNWRVVNYQRTNDVKSVPSMPGAIAVSAMVNFNSAGVTTIPIPLAGFSNYIVSSIRISKASASLTSAICEVGNFAGTWLVSPGTAVTVSATSPNTPNNAQSLVLENVGDTETINYPALGFQISTPTRSPATGVVTITIIPVS